jgi:hypothetical protein
MTFPSPKETVCTVTVHKWAKQRLALGQLIIFHQTLPLGGRLGDIRETCGRLGDVVT